MLYNKSHKDYPPNAIYIGRGSPYGNPYVIGIHGTRDQCIEAFERDVLPTMVIEPLRGKDLLCHCVPQRCHGQSIIRALRKTSYG